MRRVVFITGSTGLIGRALVERLVERGHDVLALARSGSEAKVPRGARVVAGDALQSGAWASEVPRGAVFVHLVGTAHPAPWKAAEFERVDWGSLRVAVDAARAADVERFIYLSVAQPAPVMRAYVAVRARGEKLVAENFANATFVRPWYVLGPARRWPLALVPLYALLDALPATRDSARRLGLVTLEQMTCALADSVRAASLGHVVLEVPAIRDFALQRMASQR
jgi:nucleoside-diphosphate-sugar epimerase